MSEHAGIVSVLRSELGDDLRAICLSASGMSSYVLPYVRDDIKQSYTREEYEAIFQEFTASSAASPHIEDLWKAGAHDSIIYTFEEATICHYLSKNTEIAVWFDSDTEVAIEVIVDLLREAGEARPGRYMPE